MRRTTHQCDKNNVAMQKEQCSNARKTMYQVPMQGELNTNVRKTTTRAHKEHHQHESRKKNNTMKTKNITM
jgi:hypothetical protein